jgi:hypothetical protein
LVSALEPELTLVQFIVIQSFVAIPVALVTVIDVMLPGVGVGVGG